MPSECVLVANLLSWPVPTECMACAQGRSESDTTRQLWGLKRRLEEPLVDDTAADMKRPSLPEDLFKDFEKNIPSDRFVAPSTSEQPSEDRSLADGVGPPPDVTQPSTENVPSPDSLFKSLAGPKRRSG